MKKAYEKKKQTIKKKIRELSILCDIKACAILVSPNGEVDTWPENPTDLNPIIQSYKKSPFDGKRKVKVEDVIDVGYLKKKSKKKNLALFYDNDDQWLNNLSRESRESLLVKLTLKLEAVEKRIEFLKMVNNGHGVVGDVGGSTSSGKEVVLANQETHNSDVEFLESNIAINGGQLNQENYSLDELWGSAFAITNGDQLGNSTAYHQGREIAMADQENHDSVFEFWGSTAGINGDQGQGVDILGHEGQLMVMPNEMNMWETLSNLDNVQNFGCDDLWSMTTGSEFDVLTQEATGFGTFLNQQTLSDDSFMALKSNYDYSIPFFSGAF